jgi:hypothetical protein
MRSYLFRWITRGMRSSPPTIGKPSSSARIGSAPGVEVVGLPVFVERLGRPSVKKNHRPLRGRHLDRLEVPVQDQHRQSKHLSHPNLVAR